MPDVLDRQMDIHTYFGLTYANYLVLNRSLLQSMPEEWQHKFVEMLGELDDEFSHIETAQCFEVVAGVEDYAENYSIEDLKERFGITPTWEVPELDEDDPGYDDAWDEFHCEVEWINARGENLGRVGRFVKPCEDPVPHYSRGRTRITRHSELSSGDNS